MHRSRYHGNRCDATSNSILQPHNHALFCARSLRFSPRAPPTFPLPESHRFLGRQELFEGLHFLIFFVCVTFILSTVGGMLFFHHLGGGRRWATFEPHNEAKRGGDAAPPPPPSVFRPLPPPHPAPTTALGALAEFWRQGAAEAEDEYLRMRRRCASRLPVPRRRAFIALFRPSVLCWVLRLRRMSTAEEECPEEEC